MSKLIILAFALFCYSNATLDRTYVFDKEDLFTDTQEEELQNMIMMHESVTTNEIAIVTTPDWGDKENALFFSVNFYDTHRIGKEKKNNGVVMVISKQQRETRITTGYGTEEVLKDEIAKNIIDSVMIPRFKEGRYFVGVKNGAQAVIDFLEKPGNEIK
ncbi:TPM domain-containing protein [Marivirga sp.]|uniref:TPM domain-containing protein n=1 Tax=Marivirga sp. TaxID=2018662 RepID=UPI003DA78D9B